VAAELTEVPKLRALVAGDVAHVVRLFSDVGLSTDSLAMSLESRIDDRSSVDVGAFVGEQLVGAALATQTVSHLFLSHLAVAEAFRRRGIGRLLHDTLVEEAVRRGSKGIIADSWLTATPFYYSLGYRLPGAVFMVHDLSRPQG